MTKMTVICVMLVVVFALGAREASADSSQISFILKQNPASGRDTAPVSRSPSIIPAACKATGSHCLKDEDCCSKA